MPEDLLLQISNRLHNIRKEKNVTLQQLAENAGVSKGLVSQIENGRSVPSLPVLLNLIKALAIDFNQFFRDIHFHQEDEGVMVRYASDYQPFEKENANGFFYQRILSTTVQDYHIDIVMLSLTPGATRPPVSTEAFEYKYILRGNIQYIIGEKRYTLSTGDSIFFDGSKPHVPENTGVETAEMLVVYFFKRPE